MFAEKLGNFQQDLSPASAGFLLAFLFDTEDGNDIFL
jgi:hypothetical protein